MKTVEGRYTTATIYADIVEDEALKQIETICNQPFAEGSHIAVMPDVHAGKGCTIGFTMTLNGRVCPNLVGVDIGCGMLVTELGKIDIDYEKLDEIIRTYIPSGDECRSLENINEIYHLLETHEEVYAVASQLDMFKTPVSFFYELQRLGTLGGGNHFIEIDADQEGNKYLIVHSGSRHLGVEICKHFMSQANKNREGSIQRRRELIEDTIRTLKEQGRQKEIEDTRKAILSSFTITDEDELAYLEGSGYSDYLADMSLAMSYAEANRQIIAHLICKYMNWDRKAEWSTVHNYIDSKRGIVRKGAISLELGEKALVPINMRDGSLIVKGKGNPYYNYSGPHGAGRLMSRSEARKAISLEDFKDSMKDIWTSSVCEETLDESAFAYKPADSILNALEDTAEIVTHLKPLYNFKAH